MTTRNSKGQFAKGTSGNPEGRPKRADEQFLVDLWEKHGKKKFSKAVRDDEQWALKLLIDKLFANKKETDVSFRDETPVKQFDGVLQKEISYIVTSAEDEAEKAIRAGI